MSDVLRTRLRQAMAARGWDMAETSRKAGLGRTFVHDFLERPQRQRTLRADSLEKLARALAVSPSWLTGTESAGPNAAPPPANARDVPVFGTAAGSVAGSIAVSGDVIDWLARPPGLASARDAYALFVTGESMWPKYTTGDVVFIHPHRPVRPGDSVVIQQRNGEGETLSFLKDFIRRTPQGFLVRQYNPSAEIEFPAATVAAMHRVLTSGELLGIA